MAVTAGRLAGRRGGAAAAAFGQWLASAALPAGQLFRLLPGVAESFRRGFVRSSGSQIPSPLMPPLAGRPSVVVSVCNEAGSLPAVLRELKRLPFHEIIVVVNGSQDGSFAAARSFDGVIVVHIAERLGHDVARGIGAKLSTGDFVLFIDGDMPVSAHLLSAFLVAADRGVDVALNDIMPLLPAFDRQDEVTRCKTFLNRMMGRDDLEANSMTAVPHALSRRAIEMIGYDNLAVPPKAQTLAIRAGLRIQAVQTVDVLSVNRRRTLNRGRDNPVARLIIGDHIEALMEAMKSAGTRLQWGQVSRDEFAIRRNGI
ncbi:MULTISPECIES: glycosyltransferase family 2 protein [Paenibacillus]|uniref:glycosyltransferase family 2 protein n=1 Tax=Paenibacillus TaxID=44249 RepID=UPI00048BEE0A|nr:glycosyltransferase family A protein [Paenibacillus sp. IHBB 10380]